MSMYYVCSTNVECCKGPNTDNNVLGEIRRTSPLQNQNGKCVKSNSLMATLVWGGRHSLNSIKYQRTGLITDPSVLYREQMISDTHVIDIPTIPICFKIACAVHSLPGETAFHIDGYQLCVIVGIMKSYPSWHPSDTREVSWREIRIQKHSRSMRRYSPKACIRSANMRLRNRSELVASDGLPSRRSFLRKVYRALLSRLYCRGLFENDEDNNTG